MELSEIIAAKLKKDGPVTFHDFMDMILYFPEYGYYTSAKEKFGSEGDYFTSPALTPVFGAMVGKQLEEMWRHTGQGLFTIVEYGAGTGLLCRDILEYIKSIPGFYENVEYVIIEKSPALQKREQQFLHEKVSWQSDIAEIAGFTGCILSNEVVDNFPVHRVVMKHILMEVHVGYKDGFTEMLQPAGAALQEYMKEYNINLPEGYSTEINLEAKKWIQQIGGALRKGYVITIDYGLDASTLYNTYRKNGTMMCYRKHRASEHPYLAIGEQDITSHVNFTSLCNWGFQNGLECCGLSSQSDFLLALGYREYLLKQHGNAEDLARLAFRVSRLNHLLLVEMGNKFKVLVQKKGDVSKILTGFMH